MKVLGVVGLPGSGKGELSKVAEQMHIPVVVMGDVIREEVRKAGLPPTGESMGIISRALRERDGMAAIAIACIPVVERLESELVLIDGLRGDAEVRVLQKHFSDFVLIAVTAPDETRFLRLSSRKRSDDISSLAELQKRDTREMSFGLLNALEMADIRIDNATDIETFQRDVISVLNTLRDGHIKQIDCTDGDVP
ncbi:MAG: flagellar hook-basal body complex protein FliE [Methanomicrobiales archaeon]|jgi:dephospho-CoA kinase|nr:flagellar hook-basal body complex protein FliE [Methanomicrobiales archaeon]